MGSLKLLPAVAASLLALGLAGCFGDDSPDATDPGGVALFSPVIGVTPAPNDLAFAGTADGTVNAPVADPTDFSDPQVAINALGGYSTVAPMVAPMSRPVDPDSLADGAVRVFQASVDPATFAVTGIGPELQQGTDFQVGLSRADPEGTLVVITPLRPLAPQTTYLVAVTTAVQFTTGGRAAPSSLYRFATGSVPATQAPELDGLPADQVAIMEGVRQLVNTHVAALAGAGIPASDLAVSWTLTTQSIGAVLAATRDAILGDGQVATPVLTDPGTRTPGGAAEIYPGVLAGIPYYLGVPSATDPLAPLEDFWQAAAEVAGERNLTAANPLPRETDTDPDSAGVQRATIPLLVTVPVAGEGPPWPAVIFQHGITADRSSALAVADSLAQAGFATVAIDLPLHGLTSGDAPLVGALFDPDNERTFNLDLVDNATGVAGPDGVIDDSGTHFINLTSLLTSRDNLRQGAADLFSLLEAIPDMQVGEAAADRLDPERVYFLGHSLGGMVGGVFLALDALRTLEAGDPPQVRDAVLAMPGGGIAKLLDGSATFGPRIAAGLAANGVIKGSFEYERFLLAAQTAVDSGDPLNYASDTVAGRGVLMYEVVGGAGSPPDQVIPNNVVHPFPAGTDPVTVPSPTAGTDPLAAEMGLAQVSGTTSGSDLDALLRFLAGDHSSILLPTASLDATTVMQGAAATFLASDGAQVAITVPEVVE